MRMLRRLLGRTDEQGAPSPERRRFLAGLTAALGAGTAAVAGAPVVAFILSPLFKEEPDAWREVGSVSDFAPGETRKVTFADPSPLPWSGVAGRSAVWLRRTGESSFVAFAINCTHLGCPVRWLRDAELFMCPCHGGVFYQDGSVAAGPPRRELVRHRTRVLAGRVQVRTRELEITGDLLERLGEE